MNDNNQNSNSTNGGSNHSNDSKDSARFVEALESDSRLADSLNAEDLEINRFGSAVRTAADQDLPPRNEKLKELLIEKLDADDVGSNATDQRPRNITKVAAKPSKTPIARIAIAASLLLAVGLVALLTQTQYVREAARVAGEDIRPAQSNDLMELVDSSTQGLRMEKRTNEKGLKYEVQVPVTESVSDLMLPDASGGEIEVLNNDKAAKNYTIDVTEKNIPELLKRVSPSGTREMEFENIESLKREILSKHDRRTSDPDTSSSGDGSDSFGALADLRGGGGFAGRVQMFNGQTASEIGGSVLFAEQSGKGFGPAEASVGKRFKSMQRPSEGKSVVPGKDSNGRDSLNLGMQFGLQPRFEKFGYGELGGGRGGRGGRGFRRLGGEQYDPIHENNFIEVKGEQALSTFSIDVDTASYSNMRRFLNNNQLPPPDSIRIEELVNYFSYDYPQPKNGEPFSVNMELANCPWDEQHHLLRVGLKGKDVHRDERSDSNLVFLLDVSGSMSSTDKLPLLKQGLMMLVQRLSENDSVSIVTYAGNAGVVLNPTNGANKRQIEQAIETLASGGSTNGSAGINLAYELAQKQFIRNGSNRIILATDGDLNVGVTSDDALVKLIKEKASEGVFLTVLGFGTGNLKDSKLEKLADNGNGMYAYIDNVREAHKVLIDQMSGSLETIAKDVKIQIEFNPSEVSNYRLIGYENRVLAAQDFDNDRKDAGEIGAGHSVTALYEIVLAASSQPTANQHSLKYQTSNVEPAIEPDVKIAVHTGELLTLSLRYKKPDSETSDKIQFSLSDEPKSFSSASADFQFAASVASFGMLLRNSQHRGSTTLDWIEATASRSVGDDMGGYRSEFLDLVRKAADFR